MCELCGFNECCVCVNVTCVDDQCLFIVPLCCHMSMFFFLSFIIKLLLTRLLKLTRWVGVSFHPVLFCKATTNSSLYPPQVLKVGLHFNL